jgi:hypothetical protein
MALPTDTGQSTANTIDLHIVMDRIATARPKICQRNWEFDYTLPTIRLPFHRHFPVVWSFCGEFSQKFIGRRGRHSWAEFFDLAVETQWRGKYYASFVKQLIL